MILRIVAINIGMSILAGGFVILGAWLYCDPEPEGFLSWAMIGLALLVMGLIFQNFMHMRWLQREPAISRWSPGDDDEYLSETVFELLYFPMKAVMLAATLWFSIGIPTAWIFVRETHAGWGNGLVVYVLIAAAGSLTSFLQIFFYRRMLYPRLEHFLGQRGERGRAWLRAYPVPFTVRAKLLMQSFFTVIIVVMVMLAAGYGLDRNELRQTRAAHLSSMLELAAPVIDNQRYSGREIESVLETFGRLLRGGIAMADRRSAQTYLWSPNDLMDAREVLGGLLSGRRHVDNRWLAVTAEREDFRLAAVVPWDDFGGALGQYLELFMITVLLGAGIIIAVSVLASYDMSRSVQRVEKWSEQLGNGVLDVGQTVPEDDEIADLIVRLDALRRRLVGLLMKMEQGTAGTRSLSGKVQEHAVYLRQTIEEDSNLISLTASLLDRMRGSLKQHQATVGVLASASEETMTGAVQMGMVLRELDQQSSLLGDGVDTYKGGLHRLEGLVQRGRDDLQAFVRGAEEAKRALVNLDDVLDHLMETVRRSRQLVVRTNDQSGTAYDAIYRARSEISTLEETMRDSSMLIDHLGGTMSELSGVASAIHEVAEDTKLLSLNAAIRSVKAKEEGRSFAVISHTIQDLAVETQNAIEQLMEEIEGLTTQATNLEEHVFALVESLHSASTEAESGAGIWRESRSNVQEFRSLEERFEQFVHELRSYRDGVRLRQGNVQGHTQLVATLLSDLLGGLEQQLLHIGDIEDRAAQIRHFSSYQVSKGRFVADHVDQVRAMTGHVGGFLNEQLRNLDELAQSLEHLQSGMRDNVAEAKEISGGLQRLERSIRRFHDAFARFHIGEVL